MNLTSRQHRWIYLIALSLVAIGLPFSVFLISVGEILLILNFIAEGRWNERIDRLKNEPTIWFFVGFYLLHVVGLIWTNDLGFGLITLRTRLPLLIFPIIIPLSQRLKRVEFLWIAAIFSAAVIAASIVSMVMYFNLKDIPGFNYREISIFTSHIRYSLMVCLSYIILLNCAWNEEKKAWLRVAYIILAIWLSVFIFILQSMTGIVVWLLCSYMLLFYTLFHLKNNFWRISGSTILWVTPLFVFLYLAFQIDNFYPDKQADFSHLETISAADEYYSHDTTNLTLENGNYVNIYISPLELQREWDQVSNIPYVKGKDAKGQFIYTTIIRYMTSKGLRKDSIGFSQLTQEDISAIEHGTANVRFLYGNALDNRIYTVIWEFDKMMQEQMVQGHSVTQRFEFWTTGWHIFKEHVLFGVGTGDIKTSYHEMYDRLDSNLSEKHRLRAHNQFLSILISFGVFGFLLFALSVIWPFISIPNANSFLYIGFAIIIFASMFNEDTLDTQVGVTLYAMFNSLLLYSLTGIARKTAQNAKD